MLLFNGPERLSRSFAKAVSWRILGSIDTFVLGYLFTQSAKAAGGIALSEMVTKVFLFAGHERAWNKIKWGYHPDQPPTSPPNPTPKPE